MYSHYTTLTTLIIILVTMNRFSLSFHRISRCRGSIPLRKMSSSDSAGAASRFWSRSIDLKNQNSIDTKINITETMEKLAVTLREDHPDSKGVTAGIVLLPLPGLEGENKSILVPIHDGMIQQQHAKVVNHSGKNNAVLCAFSPRAQHVVVSPNEEERPVDPDRYEALERALKTNSNTTSAELLSDSLAGTPPARIYRSFVAPRAGKTHILEPVERAALRTAVQIDLALRQVRADQAAYLRNTDRSLSLDEMVFSDSSLSGSSAHRPVVHPIVLVLDNVRSAFNVGSLFRTGETAGIAELVTCGITAHPPHPKLRKTAMNSLDVVPTRHFDDIMVAVETLRREGYQIVAMETTSRSRMYTESSVYSPKVALVLGNEVTGVDTRVMDVVDAIVEIPCFGIKNSLNVASAGPIVVFEVLRQWTQKQST